MRTRYKWSVTSARCARAARMAKLDAMNPFLPRTRQRSVIIRALIRTALLARRLGQLAFALGLVLSCREGEKSPGAGDSAVAVGCLPEEWRGAVVTSVELARWRPDSIAPGDTVLATYPLGETRAVILGRRSQSLFLDSARLLVGGRAIHFPLQEAMKFEIAGIDGTPTILRAIAFYCGSGGCNGPLIYTAVDPANPQTAIAWVEEAAPALSVDLRGDLVEVARCEGRVHARAGRLSLTAAVDAGELSLTGWLPKPPPKTLADSLSDILATVKDPLPPLSELYPESIRYVDAGLPTYLFGSINAVLPVLHYSTDITGRLRVYAPVVDFRGNPNTGVSEIRAVLQRELEEAPEQQSLCKDERVLPEEVSETEPSTRVIVRCLVARVTRVGGALAVSAETREYVFNEEARVVRERLLAQRQIR